MKSRRFKSLPEGFKLCDLALQLQHRFASDGMGFSGHFAEVCVSDGADSALQQNQYDVRFAVETRRPAHAVFIRETLEFPWQVGLG
jgi:hypothetical protein